MASLCERTCRGGWRTAWGPSEELKQHYPPKHSDYRDSAPEQLSDVYRLYQPVVQRGRWTHGLIEMWFWKLKPVKHSVHIPCWDSFKWNPLKWRGPCFGRTVEECYWTGLRQTRWARAVYAANLGREYVMPVHNIGGHGYKSDIKALCWMYFLMSCVFGCGLGQIFSLCGNFCCNFGAWYSCHARERLRRRYDLPPMFFMPPGVDDCLVHFFCFYCASHQELRELAVRGVDGPGMHILDVLPHSFPNAEGIDKAKAERQVVVQAMLARPPKMFRARKLKEGALHQRVAEAAVALAWQDEEDLPLPAAAVALQQEGDASEAASQADEEPLLGWHRYSPPPPQEMQRGRVVTAHPATVDQQQQQQEQDWQPPGGASHGWRQHQRVRSVSDIPVLQESGTGEYIQVAPRAWSVAY